MSGGTVFAFCCRRGCCFRLNRCCVAQRCIALATGHPRGVTSRTPFFHTHAIKRYRAQTKLLGPDFLFLSVVLVSCSLALLAHLSVCLCVSFHVFFQRQALYCSYSWSLPLPWLSCTAPGVVCLTVVVVSSTLLSCRACMLVLFFFIVPHVLSPVVTDRLCFSRFCICSSESPVELCGLPTSAVIAVGPTFPLFCSYAIFPFVGMIFAMLPTLSFFFFPT